jgi:ABC-type dipeptide/oligopeptide/nickel transport system permease subunit
VSGLTVLRRPRPWSSAALGAGLVLLLQVGLSAWHGATPTVALLLVVLAVAALGRRLRTRQDAVPRPALR